MSTSQNENGHAFEYACIKFMIDDLGEVQILDIKDTNQFRSAQKNFNDQSIDNKDNMTRAAGAAFRALRKLEPRIDYCVINDPLELTLQADAEGQNGDVRDVLCRRKSANWEIGLSCKHNHHAVKHSRLSDTIDFGKEWLDIPCSHEYFETVVPIFSRLRSIKDNSKDNPALWNDLEDKEGEYYQPILEAFLKELNRLNETHPAEVPPRLVRYLIGEQDFYKVITDDAHRTTRIEAININGTLNKSFEDHKAYVSVGKLKLPTRIISTGFAGNSKNKVEVLCDEGWSFSMRIHNASSRIEPSLKFDIQLISLPNSIHSQIEPWDN